MRWHFIKLALRLLFTLLFRKDISAARAAFEKPDTPLGTAVALTPLVYDAIKSRLVRGGPVALAIALFAGAAIAGGSFVSYDATTRISQRIKGGTGIDILSGTISATGIAVPISIQPWGNISTAVRGRFTVAGGVSDAAFAAYTSTGRATLAELEAGLATKSPKFANATTLARFGAGPTYNGIDISPGASGSISSSTPTTFALDTILSSTGTLVKGVTIADVARTGAYADLTGKPTIPAAQVNSNWTASSGIAQILNKPTLATVATSGSYTDLSNKPAAYTLPTATTTVLGGVKPDGSSITIDGAGVISSTVSAGVSSFNSRTGVILPATDDYSVTQIAGFADYTTAGGGRVTVSTFATYTSDIRPSLDLADTALQPNGSGAGLTGVVKPVDVVNSLASTSATAPLSAAQGKVLQDGKLSSVGVSAITRSTTAPTTTTGALWIQSPNVTAVDTAKNLISNNALNLNNHNLEPYANEPMVTFNGNQYVTFYAANGNLMVGKRTLPAGAWAVVDTGKTSDAAVAPVGFVPDASDQHDVASMGIDPNGYIHIIYGRHAEPLSGYYIVSSAAENITSWATKTGMTGVNESTFTYPTFVNNGTSLFCFYRLNGSGEGELYLNKYDHTAATWSAVAHPLVNSVAATRSPYWEATAGSDGSLHLSWLWRDSYAGTNSKYSYAKSVDDGATWQDVDNNTLALPILYDASPVFDAVGSPYSTMRATNSNCIALDSDGNPHVAYGKTDKDGVFQYYHAWHNSDGWHVSQVSAFESGTWVARPAIASANGQTIIVGRAPHNGWIFAAATYDGYEYRYYRLGTDYWGGLLEFNLDFSLFEQDPSKLHVIVSPITSTTDATDLFTLEVNPSTWGNGYTYAQFFLDKLSIYNGVWKSQAVPYNPYPMANTQGVCGEGQMKTYTQGAWKCSDVLEGAPFASPTTPGVIKLGDRLSIVDGILSADVQSGTVLTVREEDGTPSGTPSILKFANGAVTNNGDGSFSIAGGTAGAPTDASYLSLAGHTGLTNERVLTGTANQITVTDNGAGGSAVLSTPQNIDTTATPRFLRIGLGTNAHATNYLTAYGGAGAIAINAGSVDTAAIQGITSSTGSGVVGGVSGSTNSGATGLRGQGGPYGMGLQAYQYSSGLTQNSSAAVAKIYRDTALNGYTALEAVLLIESTQAAVSTNYGPLIRGKKGTSVVFEVSEGGTVTATNTIGTTTTSAPSITGTVTINAATTEHYELSPTGTTTQTIAFSGNPASGKVTYVGLRVTTVATGGTTLAWPTVGSTFEWIGDAGATTLTASKGYEYVCRVGAVKTSCKIVQEAF